MGSTDFDKIDSEEELARQVTADPDLAGIPEDWVLRGRLERGFPVAAACRDKSVSVELDFAVADYFQAQGHDWQSQVNSVLRAFVESQTQPRR